MNVVKELIKCISFTRRKYIFISKSTPRLLFHLYYDGSIFLTFSTKKTMTDCLLSHMNHFKIEFY